MTRVEILLELQSLIAEYWASVDRIADMSRSSASFYTEGGEMELGSLHVRGRENIETFFASRNEKEIENRRTTRHFVGNTRLQELSDERATVRALVLVYSGNGDWPLPSAPPSAVGDFIFQCVHDRSHGWLFEKVSANSVFLGAGAPSFSIKRS